MYLKTVEKHPPLTGFCKAVSPLYLVIRRQDRPFTDFDLFSVGMRLAETFLHHYKQPPPMNAVNLSGMFRSCMCWLFAILSDRTKLVL